MKGLKVSKDRGLTHIVLQSDSQSTIKAIKGDKYEGTKDGRLIGVIRSLQQ